MKTLHYKTRGASSPQGKAKIWFCAHPEDYATYLEPISTALLSNINGAVWYDSDPAAPWDLQELQNALEEMQLFVMPVTTRLLTTPNRALETEFPLALAKNIPVLPLMQEAGLADLFNEKCGELQYLDPNQQDSTTLSYEEKLKNYLASVLVGDELAEKVRAAFDAYIFLSYRKKDRKYAQDLMRLIHRNDFCRDIAIWYDEYLIPGENFNSAIAKALEKCDLFALAVTPNLVNEVNYVMTTEYPAAEQAGKPIVAAELEATDREQLKKQYKNIPDCIDAYNNVALSETLKNTLTKIALKENDKDPQHNFFIGLAYLSGIDVEVDLSRALALLEGAADAGLPDAIQKLASMYRNGAGVPMDLAKAIAYEERLAALYEKDCQNDPTEQNNDRLLHTVWRLGDDWYQLRDLAKAKEQYTRLHQIGTAALKRFGNIKARRDLSVGCFKLGDLLEAEGNLAEAEKMYQQAVDYRRQVAETEKTKQSRRELYEAYIKLGDVAKNRYDLSAAAEYYRQAQQVNALLPQEDTDARHQKGTYLERLGDVYLRQGLLRKASECFDQLLTLYCGYHEETQTADSHRCVMIAYHKCGLILMAEEDFDGAQALFQQSLAIGETLAEETNTLLAQQDLAICLAQMGDVFRAKDDGVRALGQYERALAILEPMLQKVPAADLYHTTITTYQTTGDLHLRHQQFPAAAEAYEKARRWSAEFLRRSDMSDARYDMLICCERLGDLYRHQGNPDAAAKMYQEGIDGCEGLLETVCTPDLLRTLAICYTKQGSLMKEKGEPSAAKEFLLRALALLERGDKEIDNKKFYHSALIVYANLYDVYQMERDPQQAREMLVKSFEITKSLLGGFCDRKERMYLSTLCLHLGNSFAKDQEATAAEAYEKGIELCTAMESETEDPFVRRTLQELYSAFGRLRKQQEKPAAAAELFQKALEEARLLAEQTHLPEDRNALATAHYNLAFLSETKKEHLTQAYEIWSELSARFPAKEFYAKRKELARSKLEE